MHFDSRTAVADLARQLPATVRVFQGWQIDYCCGGQRSLAEASEEAGVDLGELMSALRRELAENGTPERDWSAEPLVSLIAHIEGHYHRRLRERFPTLLELAERVADHHGGDRPSLVEVSSTLSALREEMFLHMQKEELVLFPLIRQRESASKLEQAPPLGAPVAAMEDDHREVADALRKLRRLTNGYLAPDEACNSYRGLFQGISELETETHQHIHLENNILFPRALELR